VGRQPGGRLGDIRRSLTPVNMLTQAFCFLQILTTSLQLGMGVTVDLEVICSSSDQLENSDKTAFPILTSRASSVP
jgi:predicted RNase H-like nuclease